MTTRVTPGLTTGVVKDTDKASKLTTSSNASDEGKILQLNASGEIPAGYIPHTVLKISESSSDPANPAEGNASIWVSDGTGSGDDGDVMI